MARLTLLHEPDPRLRRVSAAIVTIDETVRQELAAMKETLEYLEGLGLAAPQVNILKRMAIYDTNNFPPDEGVPVDGPRFLVMINPKITERASEETTLEEGCFSLPETQVSVSRPETCTVTFLDEDSQTQALQARGLFAKCVQHEIDHLDGVLTIDYLSPLKKELTLEKLVKLKRKATTTHATP
jgi:peptide deformylase